MERRNYFEILGLDFDPIKKDIEKAAEKAIEEWKERTQNLLANETKDIRRQELTAELKLHDDMVETFKDKEKRNAEARKLKEQRIAQLEKLIDIMLYDHVGTPEVTNAQIRSVCSKLRLAHNTVTKVYEKKGYTVCPKAVASVLSDYFLEATQLKSLKDELKTLKSAFAADVSQQQFYPWVKDVDDLYSLACRYTGSDDVASYKKKRATELYNIMEAGSQKFVAAPNNVLLQTLSHLFSFGQSQVFISETNKKKYDQSLELEKLNSFFALLQSAPDDFKKDRYFAERCIKIIQKSFPDINLALALYNQEAGLTLDPYEQMEALIHVICRSCKTPMEFRSREEAEKGRCTVCGAELYVTCPNPKCKKKVPASADWCSCGFHISEMQFFDEYINEAQFALKEMDLVAARKQLANAQNAYPGHPKLSALQKQIEEESEKYQKPLNELQSLIEANKFCAAQKLLAKISAATPQLKLESQRSIITKKVNEAKTMMPAANLQASVRANRCVEILDIVKDYQPAIDMLGSCKPSAPINLHGAINSGVPMICTLTWNSAGDKGVSYCVVRKKNGIPQRYTDGDMLAQSLSVLEYKDTSIQPGISYGYAVFAHRNGLYSDSVTCKVEKFSELDASRIRAVTDNGVCHFSWVLPTNCIGVRILRSVNSTPPENPSEKCTVVAQNATANFDDTAVSNNQTYGYRLQCVYPYGNGFRYSEGYTISLTPEQPPKTLKDVSAKIEGRTVCLRWTSQETNQRSVLVREATSPTVRNMIGQIYSAADINAALGNGKIYANTSNSAQQCQFDIPPNTSIALAVVVISGTKGIISEVVRASSIEKCELNKTETRIEGNRLKIMVKRIPANLERIHYLVAKKVDAKIPWATVEDVKRNTLNMITAQDYIRDGLILIENPPKDELYISVIGQYKMPDGSVVYSDASTQRITNKPKAEIRYHLTWGGGLFSMRARPRDCRLHITTEAKETPTLKLVYRSDGRVPMKLFDPKTIVLHTIPESDTGFPSGEYVFQFPDTTWEKIKSQTELRLMISENDMAEYMIIPENVASLKVP